MRRAILLILFLGSFSAFAQENRGSGLSILLHGKWQIATAAHNANARTQLYIQPANAAVMQLLEMNGATYIKKYGNVFSCSFPDINLKNIASNPLITVIEHGEVKAEALDDSSNYYGNVDSVLLGQGSIRYPYNGKGVLFGIIDSGVDYSHGDFRNPGDSSTRILRFWDNNQSPVQAYDTAAINRAMVSRSISVDESWHGTHVASVAVGNGIANGLYPGAAPNASMLVTDLTPNQTFQEIMTAADTMFSYAASLRRPMVLNLSLGSNYGPHDGSDSYSQILENIQAADSGRAIVVAAGNSNTYYPHVSYPLSADTTFTYLNVDTVLPVYVQMYQDTANARNSSFRFAIDSIFSNRYRRFATTPFYSAPQILGQLQVDTLKHPNGKPYCVVKTNATLYTKGRYLVEWEVTYLRPQGVPRLVYRIEQKGTGMMHMWADDSRWIFNKTVIGRSFSDTTKYRSPDNEYAMAGYFNCARTLFAVGNHACRGGWEQCNIAGVQSLGQTAGQPAFNSSFGPNVDGYIKPDISAPGDNTMGSNPYTVPSTDNRSAKLCRHRRARGTSNAASVVSGALVLYLQANPRAGWYTMKQDMIATANTDTFTKTVPNKLWGYGKINTYRFVLKGESRSMGPLTVAEKGGVYGAKAQAYPNPLTDQLTVKIDPSVTGMVKVELFDALGRCVINQMVYATELAQFETGSLKNGMYFIRVQTEEGIVLLSTQLVK